MLDFRHLLHGESATRINQRNALAPFLWLSGIVPSPLLLFGFKVPQFAGWAFGLACLPFIVTLGVGVFFAIFDRDRLQTENYLIKRSALAMSVETMRGPVVNTTELAVVSAPPLETQLPTGVQANG